MDAETANVRYIVDDVDAAITFYTGVLGFELLSHPAPAFADVRRGALRLLLSGPASSGGRPLPDGRVPTSGGSPCFRLHDSTPRGELSSARRAPLATHDRAQQRTST